MNIIVLMNQLVLLRVLMPENSLKMVKEINEIVGFQFWQTEYLD